jgi:hypothetical protein
MRVAIGVRVVRQRCHGSAEYARHELGLPGTRTMLARSLYPACQSARVIERQPARATGIRINRQWRICFVRRFGNADPVESVRRSCPGVRASGAVALVFVAKARVKKMRERRALSSQLRASFSLAALSPMASPAGFQFRRCAVAAADNAKALRVNSTACPI